MSDSDPRLTPAAKALKTGASWAAVALAEAVSAITASQGPEIHCKKCHRRHRRRAGCAR